MCLFVINIFAADFFTAAVWCVPFSGTVGLLTTNAKKKQTNKKQKNAASAGPETVEVVLCLEAFPRDTLVRWINSVRWSLASFSGVWDSARAWGRIVLVAGRGVGADTKKDSPEPSH